MAQADYFADAFIHENIVSGYDIVTTLCHNNNGIQKLTEFTADDILFRETHCKKRDILMFKLCFQCCFGCNQVKYGSFV